MLAEEFGTRAEILLAFIGPAIEQAIVKAFPNSEIAAGVGEGAINKVLLLFKV